MREEEMRFSVGREVDGDEGAAKWEGVIRREKDYITVSIRYRSSSNSSSSRSLVRIVFISWVGGRCVRRLVRY